jgi:hypothetical protein
MIGEEQKQLRKDWLEYLTKMPTDAFLDLAKIYLGEIRTPFNKQRLQEQLSIFLHDETNRKNIKSLLSPNDIKILALIHLTGGVSEKQIGGFFTSGKISHSLKEHIVNLEERLLIFRRSDSNGDFFSLNPLLQETIEPLLTKDALIPRPVSTVSCAAGDFFLTPGFLAAYVSFVLGHEDLCKADGTPKKKAVRDFALIYSKEDAESDSAERILKDITSAFMNLNLIKDNNGKSEIDWTKLERFAQMEETHQYAYLCASLSCPAVSRRGLQTNAQLLLDTISMIPQGGYTRKSILQAAVLASTGKNKSVAAAGPSRFESLMAETKGESEHTNPMDMMDRLFDGAVSLGLLHQTGKDENGEKIFEPSDFLAGKMTGAAEEKNVVSIDAGFSVTVMPGLSLGELLPLMKCLDISHFDVAAEYELSRSSVMRAFDLGCTPKEITNLLDSHSSYELPQNLHVAVEDWYNSYSSAMLYHGYVLKLSERNAVIAEKNPSLAPHIVTHLAPGVLLLDFANDDEASSVISKAGIDAVGKVQSVGAKTVVPPLPPLKTAARIRENPQQEIQPADDYNKIIEEMHKYLDSLSLEDDAKEKLSERIDRHVIVNSSQLTAASIRFELTEAFAMDYAGKIHVAESAIQENKLLEIEIEDEKIIQGMPVGLEKKSGNATVTLAFDDGQPNREILLSSAVRVKKIRAKIIW